jgi:lactoylglutathione lyase
MHLAKPRFDIGLSTNDLGPMLAFWQGEVGAVFDHILPLRPGFEQHRHDVLGSVLKINHLTAPLPANPPSGYVELLIVREGLAEPRALADPEGNRVSLVPKGWSGVDQIGVKLKVRDLDAQRRFYVDALSLTEEAPGAFRAGEGMIFVEAAPDAPAEGPFDGPGWRYITFQVFKADTEHAHALANGGREAMAPTTLGTTARISMVKDPAGNWIELSQRANLTGSLEPG